MTSIGLIGAGGISKLHLPAYRNHPETVQLTGVCDAAEGRARDIASEFGIDYWTDYEVFIEEATIDAVDIALPHHLHYPVAKTALEADTHVLIEKPFATSLTDCVDLVETAETRDLTLMVGQMQRYHPPYRALKRCIERGELGTIRHARCDALVNQGDMVPSDHWLYDGDRSGGGGIIGYSVHKIDLLRYLLGDVTRAISWDRTVDPTFESAEDYSVGLLEFEIGTVADFFTTLSAPAMPYTEMFWLFGDNGVVHTLPAGEQEEGYAGTPDTRINVQDDPESRKRFEELIADDTDLPTDNAFVNEILHFVDCIETGREPISSGRDNLGTMATIFGIYRSAERDGTRVRIDEIHRDAQEGQ